MSHEDDNGLLGYSMLGLSRDTIDIVCTEQLMRTIVGRLLDDALGDTPRLSGEHVGEATGCIEWLAERNYFEAQKMALTYSRKYGGGGVVCIIDDGRPCEMEVDINAIRGVSDFVAVPKWYMTPADSGSPRVGRSWYGPRFGRPEHYMVSVPTATPDATMSLAGVAENESRVRSLSGRRFHRSRVIAWPYQDDLDLRQARRFLNWNGWGPGVVEACLAPYLARRDGALRMTDIIRGSHFNVLAMQNVAHAQTTPDGGSGIRNAVAWVKYCLGLTGGGLPFTVIDTASRLEAVSHTLTGLSDVLGEQRRFLLDMLPEYTEVVLFGSGNSGLSGDSKAGEWQSYYNNVAAFQRQNLWQAGAFGGGMQQAVRLAMLCKTGPTKGQLDMTVKPVWPPLWTESAEAASRTRKANAEARAMDRVNLGMTAAAFLRHDPTLAGAPGSTYPSLDVDEATLPTTAPGGGALEAPLPGADGKAITQPGEALNAIAASDAPPTDATQPAPVQDAQVPLFEAVAPTPAEEAASSANVAATLSASLPADIATEKELAKALAMSTIAFRKWIETTKATTYPTPPGTRGGHRYSLGEVLKAWNDAARRRVDSMRPRSSGARRRTAVHPPE